MNMANPRVESEMKSLGAQPLESLMKAAWDIRVSNFGSSISWVNPIRTGVLSVTGTACSLKCAHCGGKYLRHMLPIERRGELDRLQIPVVLWQWMRFLRQGSVERYVHVPP